MFLSNNSIEFIIFHRTEGRNSTEEWVSGIQRVGSESVRLEGLWGYSFLILLVRNERFCLDEVFYLLVMDEAARFMGFVRVLIPLDYVGL